MRTTLTLDDDLAEQLSALARDTRQPFKVILNATLRRGLDGELPAAKPFVYEAHPGSLRPGIDVRRLNELPWELDEERFGETFSNPRR